MNKYTHKTVRVKATMETDMYMDINVPRGIKDNDIGQIIYDGILDGTNLVSDWEIYQWWDWRWQEHDCAAPFNPNAPDYSKDFRERYNLTQGEYVTVKMLTANSEEKEE